MIFATKLEKSREILRKFWGYESFRPLQEEIVDSVIYGHDTLVILPTGGGKSICFQVPGIALDGVTLVISPLIALMQDQVTRLEKRGIQASLITSGLSYREIDITLDNARFGNTKFLYTSPERLKSDLFIERFKRMNVGLIVVDEAHCISEWGHDFRPSYREIANVREYHPNAPLIAVTASATDNVKEDILSQLHMKNSKEFYGVLERDNISYSLQESENKITPIIEHCTKHPDETGIVYCQTRRSVKQIVTQLRAQRIPAGIYHGGMSSEDRTYMLNEWLEDRLKVMVATNAFGMGIDKPNVRYVLHYELPNNIEAYYQEAGRAGRDGLPSIARGYWNSHDLELMQERFESQYPDKKKIIQIYNAICNYLKIAIGSGKDETYPFNLQAFCNTFEISATETYYALKILQLNGNLGFTESSFYPTRLKFIVGNKALYTFQVGHESLASLITLLTRSYPGIFDRFVIINETEISKRFKVSKDQLQGKLKSLEEFGLIDIQFQSSLPQITFLEERLDENNLIIKPEIYQVRREREQGKLDAMMDFIKTKDCRSQKISSYFSSETKPCGICDNCSKTDVTSAQLVQLIKSHLPSSFNALTEKTPASDDKLQEVIRMLMHEEEIYYEEGIYFRKE